MKITITRKQYRTAGAGLLLLVSGALAIPSHAAAITLACNDPNARTNYPEGPDGTYQCTIQNTWQNTYYVQKQDARTTATFEWAGGKKDDKQDVAIFDSFSWGTCGGTIPGQKSGGDPVQCTFTINFKTDELVDPGGEIDNSDKGVWKLKVSVEVSRLKTGGGDYAEDLLAASASNISVADPGAVPEPSSFYLFTAGCLLVSVARVRLTCVAARL